MRDKSSDASSFSNALLPLMETEIVFIRWTFDDEEKEEEEEEEEEEDDDDEEEEEPT